MVSARRLAAVAVVVAALALASAVAPAEAKKDPKDCEGERVRSTSSAGDTTRRRTSVCALAWRAAGVGWARAGERVVLFGTGAVVYWGRCR